MAVESFTIVVPRVQPNSEELILSGLEKNVWDSWEAHYAGTLNKVFAEEAWKEDFKMLGISQLVIDRLSKRLKDVEKNLTPNVVWSLLGRESVGLLPV